MGGFVQLHTSCNVEISAETFFFEITNRLHFPDFYGGGLNYDPNACSGNSPYLFAVDRLVIEDLAFHPGFFKLDQYIHFP